MLPVTVENVFAASDTRRCQTIMSDWTEVGNNVNKTVSYFIIPYNSAYDKNGTKVPYFRPVEDVNDCKIGSGDIVYGGNDLSASKLKSYGAKYIINVGAVCDFDASKNNRYSVIGTASTSYTIETNPKDGKQYIKIPVVVLANSSGSDYSMSSGENQYGITRKKVSEEGVTDFCIPQKEAGSVESSPSVKGAVGFFLKYAIHTHTHSYSAATCTTPPTCSCGATSGSALGHSFTTAATTSNPLRSAATCTAKATYWRKCTRCSTSAKDIDNTKYDALGNVAGHTWTTSGASGNASFLKTAATCKTPAYYWNKCSACGSSAKNIDNSKYSSYGSVIAHNFNDPNPTKYVDDSHKESTVYNFGWQKYMCQNGCGECTLKNDYPKKVFDIFIGGKRVQEICIAGKRIEDVEIGGKSVVKDVA